MSEENNETRVPRRYQLHDVILENIKKHMPELEKLMERASSHWEYEDPVYRFYHMSFKVYNVQYMTKKIVELLKKIAPEGCKFNPHFETLYEEGTGKQFELSHNKEWLKHTRPLIEVFFHARYFLEMAIKYGKSLKHAPSAMPSGWAALMYFYGLR